MLGHRFTDGKIEPQDQYLKRLSGLQRLYSAILITKQKRSQQNQAHPHGLENGWIWMSNFLNLEPLPEICATLLLEFIQVCGADMWQTYKRQFLKLLLVLQQAYMVKLDEVILSKFDESNNESIRTRLFAHFFCRSIPADRMLDSKYSSPI